MKKVFSIYLDPNRIHKVNGDIITVNEKTGQSTIYKGINPHYTMIVAVVPGDMVIIVDENNPTQTDGTNKKE